MYLLRCFHSVLILSERGWGWARVIERDRDRERGSERVRERHTQRQTDRQTDRQMEAYF